MYITGPMTGPHGGIVGLRSRGRPTEQLELCDARSPQSSFQSAGEAVSRLRKDSGSQKLHHFSEKCLTSHLHSSVSRGFRTKNSSAIDRAAAARSESDEFFVLNPLVIEQGLIQCLKPPKRCCNFWDPESKTRAASLLHFKGCFHILLSS